MSNNFRVPVRTYLDEKELPKQWYNIQADMPTLPAPYLNPQTMEEIGPEDLAALFPMGLIMQEMSQERYIDIPEEVQELYRTYRSTPLIRAYQLEKALDTPAKIYFKYEGASPSGSHKLNTAIPQVYYNKIEGINKISTETGAGQWGTALSIACKMFDVDLTVFMVKCSAQQKPYRKSIIETFDARVYPSPSDQTDAGRKILEETPDNPGSLGIAISEAVEVAAKNKDTNYALGSVLNHVLMHQTVIGMEAKKQMEKIGEYPDMVIGCVGGGSNFAGISFPFIQDKLTKDKDIEFIAVEPTACPTLTRGKLAYDYGDTAKMAPVTMMYTLGHDFIPAGIHAGGLRYHGASALISQLISDGIINAIAVKQTNIFESAKLFAHTEGILPAPESAHAIHATIEEALACKESGEEKTILFCLSGHGHFDLSAYDAYNHGKIVDADLPEQNLTDALSRLPKK